MQAPRILVLPGWQGAGPAAWLARWAAAQDYRVVAQHDWLRPLRGDWLMRLDEAVQDAQGKVVLLAHCLGCHQVAAWAAHSRHTHQVAAALLLAPLDVQSPALSQTLPSWRAVPRQRLPFKAMLVGSDNDTYCHLETAQALATEWGAQWRRAGPVGHLNDASTLDDWPQGQLLLTELLKD